MDYNHEHHDPTKDLLKLREDPNEKSASISTVSANFNITEGALRMRYRRTFGKGVGRTVFNEHQELLLVRAIEALTRLKDLPSRKRIRELAETMFGKKLGEKWCFNFIKRNSAFLTLDYPKIISPTRGRQDLVLRTKCFITQWSLLEKKRSPGLTTALYLMKHVWGDQTHLGRLLVDLSQCTPTWRPRVVSVLAVLFLFRGQMVTHHSEPTFSGQKRVII